MRAIFTLFIIQNVYLNDFLFVNVYKLSLQKQLFYCFDCRGGNFQDFHLNKPSVHVYVCVLAVC